MPPSVAPAAAPRGVPVITPPIAAPATAPTAAPWKPAALTSACSAALQVRVAPPATAARASFDVASIVIAQRYCSGKAKPTARGFNQFRSRAVVRGRRSDFSTPRRVRAIDHRPPAVDGPSELTATHDV